MNYKTLLENCNILLNEFDEANKYKEYLNSRLSQNILKKFSFGYFPPSEHINSLFSLFPKEDLYKLKLIYDVQINDLNVFYKKQKLFFENHNLIMPYKDVYGNIIALVGRTILSETQRKNNQITKYKNTSFDKGKHLFGLYEAKESILKNNYVYIVEGQFDCIKSFDKGFENVVALGSSNMTADQLCLICRYTSNIFLLLDNDEAGNSGREKIIKKFGKYANIENIYLPEGYKDIDEYFSDNDLDSFKFSLKN